eukprot:1026049-Amphidinium_carterae.1
MALLLSAFNMTGISCDMLLAHCHLAHGKVLDLETQLVESYCQTALEEDSLEEREATILPNLHKERRPHRQARSSTEHMF